MRERVMFEFTSAERERISARWPTAMDFYGERDDRTARLVADVGSYASVPVEIHIDPTAADDVTVQRITLVVANLTVRWARRVSLILENDPPLAPLLLRRDDETTLGDRLSFEMATADPFGDFIVGSLPLPSPTGVSPLRVFIGPWRHSTTILQEDFQIHAVAWTALGRRGRSTVQSRGNLDLPATTAAAALAGALGAADLFKRAIGHPRERWMSTFAWDTWSSFLSLGADSWSRINNRVVPEKLELGSTLLAGVGAIGSAFVYLADMMPVAGHLTLFDRDAIEITNLNRSPLFNVLHALEKPAKTAAAAEYLSGRGLTTTAVNGLWREHASVFAQQEFDVWISLTNEDGAWGEVPFHLPPIVIHGTTTSGWGFGAGRHIPIREDCTLCRMPRPFAEFRGPCGEGEIAPGEGAKEIRASLPFLSTAAAALMMSGYMQLNDGAEVVELPNDISVDLGVGLPAVVALSRPALSECRGCRTLKARAWRGRGGRGRFAVLSNV